MAPPSPDLRQRVTVTGTGCPQCGEALSEAQLAAGGEATCASCGARWAPALEVTGAANGAQGYAYLPRDELHRRLAAIAGRRGGRIGRRHLEQEAPELLFNCVAHHGSYRAARRHFGRWLAQHPSAEAEPSVVRVGAASGDTWCPFCHDWFEEREERYACACGAVFHPDCRAEAGRCTSLGCDAPYRPAAPRAAQEDPGRLGRLLRRWRDPEQLDAHTGFPLVVRLLIGLAFFLPLTALLLTGLWEVLSGALPFAGQGKPLVAGFMILFWWVTTGVVSFGVRGARLDGRARTLRPYYALALPFGLGALRWWREPLAVPDDARVRLTREVWGRGREGGGSWVYPITVHGLLVGHTTRHDRARLRAERIAKLLGLGLFDATANTYRPAGTLDDPWLRRQEAIEPPGELPPGDRLSVLDDGVERSYRIAPRGASCLGVLAALAALTAAALVAIPQADPRAHVGLVALTLILAVPSLAVALLGAFVQRTRESVAANPKRLRRTRHTWAGDWTTTIPADELEELEICRPVPESDVEALAIRSDRRTIEVGEGLSPEALRWLRLALAADLRGEPPGKS